jgi:hypothetical protein
MFVFDPPSPRHFRCVVHTLIPRLPPLEGQPIRIQSKIGLRGAGGEVHAGAFLRERRIVFDPALARQANEFARIFVHELFHFVWWRFGNPLRRSYEEMVRRECAGGARGELGWSAERRKAELSLADREQRSRRWRDYVCESFCDTAAWRFAGLSRHPEFTLSNTRRRTRQAWFEHYVETKRISI